MTKKNPEDLAESSILTDHIHNTYLARIESKYPFNSRDMRILKEVLAFCSLPQAMALWDYYLSQDSEWDRKMGHSVGEFRRQLPRLLENADWKHKMKKYENVNKTVELDLAEILKFKTSKDSA